LPLFLDQNKNAVGFAHLDMDTYRPGRFTLEKLKPRFKSGSLILFDDFYGHGGWRNADYKSLKELFEDQEYEFLAFGKYEALIRIL